MEECGRVGEVLCGGAARDQPVLVPLNGGCGVGVGAPQHQIPLAVLLRHPRPPPEGLGANKGVFPAVVCCHYCVVLPHPPLSSLVGDVEVVVALFRSLCQDADALSGLLLSQRLARGRWRGCPAWVSATCRAVGRSVPRVPAPWLGGRDG